MRIFLVGVACLLSGVIGALYCFEMWHMVLLGLATLAAISFAITKVD